MCDIRRSQFRSHQSRCATSCPRRIQWATQGIYLLAYAVYFPISPYAVLGNCSISGSPTTQELIVVPMAAARLSPTLVTQDEFSE
jgi:hypothetical protein